MDTKVCCKCKKEKPLIEFVRNKYKHGGYTGYCRVCKRVVDNEYYKTHPNRRQQIRFRDRVITEYNREIVSNYFSSHPCIRCGNTNKVVLDFHHRKDKNYEVVRMLGLSTKRLLEEIQKCDVLCANCHRITHAEMRDSPCGLIG